MRYYNKGFTFIGLLALVELSHPRILDKNIAIIAYAFRSSSVSNGPQNTSSAMTYLSASPP